MAKQIGLGSTRQASPRSVGVCGRTAARANPAGTPAAAEPELAKSGSLARAETVILKIKWRRIFDASKSKSSRGDARRVRPDAEVALLRLRGVRQQLLFATAVLTLGGVILWALQKATADVSFDALVMALRATRTSALLIALTATVVSTVPSSLRSFRAALSVPVACALFFWPRFVAMRSATRWGSGLFGWRRPVPDLHGSPARARPDCPPYRLHLGRFRSRARRHRRARPDPAGRSGEPNAGYLARAAA